mmetsp:Transcript_14282/g.26221  ORF Transcript_14282/g.26221 Transcript_14282/m.26221 type:complete len:215 (-) Transcript_14282:24477-25121(-)
MRFLALVLPCLSHRRVLELRLTCTPLLPVSRPVRNTLLGLRRRTALATAATLLVTRMMARVLFPSVILLGPPPLPLSSLPLPSRTLLSKSLSPSLVAREVTSISTRSSGQLMLTFLPGPRTLRPSGSTTPTRPTPSDPSPLAMAVSLPLPLPPTLLLPRLRLPLRVSRLLETSPSPRATLGIRWGFRPLASSWMLPRTRSGMSPLSRMLACWAT